MTTTINYGVVKTNQGRYAVVMNVVIRNGRTYYNQYDWKGYARKEFALAKADKFVRSCCPPWIRTDGSIVNYIYNNVGEVTLTPTGRRAGEKGQKP